MIIAIGISLLFTAFFTMNTVPHWLDFKPFNCVVCLSFWTILLIHLAGMFFPEVLTIARIVALAGMGAYGASVAKRLLFRI